MATFKKELLTRFVGTDEGEVTQYLGCELIRDRGYRRVIAQKLLTLLCIVDIEVLLDVCPVW